MFKSVAEELWVFDLEWVPDPETGRRAYDLPAAMPDVEVVARMFQEAGADEDNPRPFLKTALCRVISISVLKRFATGSHPVRLELISRPNAGDPPLDEAALIAGFLGAAGKSKPQLVGYNLRNSDLPILLQRALAFGVTAPEFCSRPERPWDGVDYFSSAGDAVVDLMEVFGIRGRGSPSLHDLASAASIPGKLGTSGSMVYDLWQAGELRRIVEYNEFDVITTYLIWLRAAHLAGFVSSGMFLAEERQLDGLLRDRIAAGAAHLERYVERWSPGQGVRLRA